MFKRAFNMVGEAYGYAKQKASSIIDNATGAVVAVTGTAMAVTSTASNAVPPDFTALTAGIDLSTVQTAAMTALVALLGYYLIVSGGKKIISFFKG